MENAFAFLPVYFQASVFRWCLVLTLPYLCSPTPCSRRAKQLGARGWGSWVTPHAPASSWGHPTEWVGGWSFDLEGAATPRTGPACSRKLLNVCARQLPVCLLELCKQLQLNALETLPNDRINPQGKRASVVKDYINLLKSPSTALRHRWYFSCLDKKVASGQSWEMPERPLSDLWALLSPPFLFILLWDRLPAQVLLGAT